MEPIITKLNTVLSLMGFGDARVTLDGEHRKVSIVIDDESIQPHVSAMLSAFDHLLNLMLRRDNQPTCIVDLNFYRRERERLIVELARAAARKAVVSRAQVELPPMNAYERRLVHLEITTHPELKTESVGAGKERRVVIRHLAVGA